MKSLKLITVLILSLSVFSCKEKVKKAGEKDTAVNTSNHIISSDLKWSERMLLSEMNRFPESWMLDFHDKPKWSYPNGLVLNAAKRVYDQTGKEKYYDYIYGYPDTMINPDGSIKTYSLEKQNLDMLKSGDVLLYVYEKTGEERFKNAIELLRSQIDTQPRTSEGGFWHKKRYPHQMWLDGLFMAEPFYAAYTQKYSEGETANKAYADIINQFDLIQKHSYDSKTGLLYHGWDESKEQIWADKETGVSPNFWSRAMGWYGMALVDVLDYIPENQEGKDRLIKYLNQFAEAIVNVQDEETGLWYQVLDQGDREGNYLEATGSSMFAYTLAKGVNDGYLPEKYLDVAKKAFRGITENLISIEENGVINLNQCCAVAGLSADRDGSFDYYINEQKRSNDPKGTGAFILTSLELDK
ncbi:glycoside hydrolase family 88/105 protein [Leeuwenhoekiella marinoflava]|uniref:Unsaturated rhamnogalacturonyl hydrolase n=2 Tax=Leeuwenhoekiella marinoflava TaxID=988 RepID=A0A4Q0PNW1_9FLAO|nr:glycoside hydrolase family 88 protein [Leeuwenhoekiella marinoflava]RXG32266.1 unsaturated rhamnogalacturonyl hydrolase [Leeuwenhoekiella marinoflava]SHE81232.1 unsaturated rhamnogalacturonyl hydrolase [Leeuwenhoekiella marinoflava DSM 3653]